MSRSVSSRHLRAYAFLVVARRSAARKPSARYRRLDPCPRPQLGQVRTVSAGLQGFDDHRHEPFQLFAHAAITKSAETAGIDLMGASAHRVSSTTAQASISTRAPSGSADVAKAVRAGSEEPKNSA